MCVVVHTLVGNCVVTVYLATRVLWFSAYARVASSILTLSDDALLWGVVAKLQH
jgi:hypothetical protein